MLILPMGLIFSCSITVSIPACHAGDRGSIPRARDFFAASAMGEVFVLADGFILVEIRFTLFWSASRLTSDEFFINTLTDDKAADPVAD